MWRALTAIFLIAGAATAGAAEWGVGTGLESRLAREVNPDYVDMRNSGLLYGKMTLRPWAFLLEGEQQARESSSGSLAVNARSTVTRLWARYEFVLPSRWTPFAAAGFGASFDQVETRFENSHDTRNGIRDLFGLGGGLSGTFNWFQVECEGRMNIIEDSKDPEFSALVRVGVLLL